ncbi:MAG: hypothetical protein SGILL_000704 [Bacillariaceae sp.]
MDASDSTGVAGHSSSILEGIVGQQQRIQSQGSATGVQRVQQQQQQQPPQPHIGKKPPPSSNNKKRRPPTKAAGTAVPPRKNRPPPKRSLSRQGSSNLDSRRPARVTVPRLKILNDEEPHRLTNPLLAMVPEKSKRSATASAAAAAATLNNDESVTAASIVPTPKAVIQVGELMNSASIIFHRPDTYPLSYLARVLGFDVDVPDMRQFLQQVGECNAGAAAPGSSTFPSFPTSLPDPATLPFRKDHVFLQVPKLGQWFRQNKMQKVVGRISGLGDHDDQETLDYIDPVYKSFLENGWDESKTRPSTSGIAGKFVQQQQLQESNRRKILESAQEVLGLSEEWTFQDWASYAEEQEQRRLEKEQLHPRQELVSEDSLVPASSPATPVDASIVSARKQSTSQRQKSQTGPMWTIDGKDVFGHLPLHIFGIIACYKGKPVALLKYQFEWYHLPASSDSNLQRPQYGTTELSQAIEAELTMVIDGFGNPVDHEQTGPSSTTFPSTEEPTTGVDDSASAGAADGVVTTEHAPLDDTVKMIMVSMALDHTRACGIPVRLDGDTTKNDSATNDSEDIEGVPMICDLKKCSSRYAILKLKDTESGQRDTKEPGMVSKKAAIPDSNHIRMLVNLPTTGVARNFFGSEGHIAVTAQEETTRQDSGGGTFSSGDDAVLEVMPRVRAKFVGDENLDIYRISPTGIAHEIPKANFNVAHAKTKESESTQLASDGNQALSDLKWSLLRYFPVPSWNEESLTDESDDEVLGELKRTQAELVSLEETLQPMARSLLERAMEERRAYEQPEARRQRVDSERILEQNQDMVKRRKDMDQVWQDQLEQDMNAVCSICNDGEVTPENQILFCEACNVAVHQMCYGIEKIPEGDYYCIPCRFFNRDRMIQTMSDRHLQDGASAPRHDLPPLKITCELCPVKQGAYTRANTTNTCTAASDAKWLHMTCAKWQGLDFVTRDDPSVVEDVTELKKESGLCEVIHGEDVVGFVEENPWTLLCPDHSEITQDKQEQQKKATPVEFLINAAKEFPLEPMPEPLLETLKPFNKLTASERKEALSIRSYEDKLIEEILTKRRAGVRCEVCDAMEEDGKNLARESDEQEKFVEK